MLSALESTFIHMLILAAHRQADKNSATIVWICYVVLVCYRSLTC